MRRSLPILAAVLSSLLWVGCQEQVPAVTCTWDLPAADTARVPGLAGFNLLIEVSGSFDSTSLPAVHFFSDLEASNPDYPEGLILEAAIGDATASDVRNRLGIRPDVVPDSFVAEALADELIQHHDVAGKRFLLLRADIARKALPEKLAAAGAIVTELTAYETRRANVLPGDVLEALRAGTIDWVTFTSSSTVRNMVDLLGDEQALINDVKRASIGPVTSNTMRELDHPPTVEATTSNLQGLIDAMIEHVGQ